MNFIDGVTNAGAMPSLELTMRYAAQRQRLMAHNIANADTPGFIARDVPPSEFQGLLQEAVADRRKATGGRFGSLDWRATRAITRGSNGLELSPRQALGGVAYHDRGVRDPERMLQALTESTSAFRVAADLYRAHRTTILGAIAERV